MAEKQSTHSYSFIYVSLTILIVVVVVLLVRTNDPEEAHQSQPSLLDKATTECIEWKYDMVISGSRIL